MFLLIFTRLHIKWPRGKTHCSLWKWVHHLQGKRSSWQRAVPLPLWTTADVCWWRHPEPVPGLWRSWGGAGKRVSEKHVYLNWCSPSHLLLLSLSNGNIMDWYSIFFLENYSSVFKMQWVWAFFFFFSFLFPILGNHFLFKKVLFESSF